MERSLAVAKPPSCNYGHFNFKNENEFKLFLNYISGSPSNEGANVGRSFFRLVVRDKVDVGAKFDG
jgi:hypothetical protein